MKYFNHFYTITSAHRKRQKNDMQTQFSYFNWLMEAPLAGPNVTLTPGIYKSTRVSAFSIYYMPWWTEMSRNVAKRDRLFRVAPNLKFLCINDLMEHERADAVFARDELEKVYKRLYPVISKYEL